MLRAQVKFTTLIHYYCNQYLVDKLLKLDSQPRIIIIVMDKPVIQIRSYRCVYRYSLIKNFFQTNVYCVFRFSLAYNQYFFNIKVFSFTFC